MLAVKIDGRGVRIGELLSVSLQRTLRVPDDGRDYPLPPGLGPLPLHAAEDFPDRVPASWRERGGVFAPLYQREALWLGFDAAAWKPCAVKVGVGKVNVVSGAPWDESLRADPQDYVVCPTQHWLDGINAGEGYIRQFVAMPLGAGYTVEAQVAGAEEFGGIQILAFAPKPGRFPDQAPPPDAARARVPARSARPSGPSGQMGLGAGGRLKQKIYPDPHGLDTWDTENRGRLFIHLINSEQYAELTGLGPPPTPVSAQTYTDHGLPWFELYDEGARDLSPPAALARVKSVADMEEQRGVTDAEDSTPLNIPDSQVSGLSRPDSEEES